jgi:Domain of unknown function (DUF4160)
VPIVAIVDGVKIMLFFRDHDPPHVHAEYGEFRARISIATASILQGDLPPGKKRRILEWAREHQEALSAAWADVQSDRKPRSIG